MAEQCVWTSASPNLSLLSLCLSLSTLFVSPSLFLPIILFLSFCLYISLSISPSLPPCIERGLGQITNKAIFIYELEDLINTYFMPSKSTLYYCCLCDLFILLRNIPSVARGERRGCNSPWTSIILDFSTGWSSMQKGHFLGTKIKTIMMIKKTWVPCVLLWSRVLRTVFLHGEGYTAAVVGIWIENHYIW